MAQDTAGLRTAAACVWLDTCVLGLIDVCPAYGPCCDATTHGPPASTRPRHSSYHVLHTVCQKL